MEWQQVRLMESERNWAIRKTMAEHIHVQVGTNSSETDYVQDLIIPSAGPPGWLQSCLRSAHHHGHCDELPHVHRALL